ncbi:MAG: hypothetical protein II194_01590 [Bacteroidales bacterium]|nr:hypothetical protein [Bacteroidales bacterium]
MHIGVGGQVDFIYGASLKPQGKTIIALPSTTNKGGSKISPPSNASPRTSIS